jgi:hypothetical protein
MLAESTINQLAIEASQNPLFLLVFQHWTCRKRNRQTVTVQSLYQALRFSFPRCKRAEFIPLLTKLAALNIGKLVYSKTGRVVALTSISCPLTDIGRLAIMTTPNLAIAFTPESPKNKIEILINDRQHLLLYV